MEKPRSVSCGGTMRLPLGYRFRPTDEELVIHYLLRKVCSVPLPASVIPELDVFLTNPSHLPGNPKENKYFFSKRRGNLAKCGRTNTGSGYWKPASGREKVIVVPGTKQAVGMKKSWVFRPDCLRTRWFMNEYRLVGSPTTRNSPQQAMEDWVVCCIYQQRSKRTSKREVIMPSIIDFMVEDRGIDDSGPPQPSSSSSVITAVSSNEVDQEASSS
ncbi:hypothetical protein RJ640_028176 [Escallonia rubra]|uniref:NAC domain-containing protein n=1 Tax=Escallonia rubra TaxID=112253 RepID=A0AA88QL87_9ASTE|nr:hypothetical protein RJ640_028176 [Escallonia rubra]